MHICIQSSDMHVHVCNCVFVHAHLWLKVACQLPQKRHAIDSVATLLPIVVFAVAAAQLKHNYK